MPVCRCANPALAPWLHDEGCPVHPDESTGPTEPVGFRRFPVKLVSELTVAGDGKIVHTDQSPPRGSDPAGKRIKETAQCLAVAFVIIHAENGDVIGSFGSREQALDRLAYYVEANPDLQDELGVRAYSDGKPLGRWHPADLDADR